MQVVASEENIYDLTTNHLLHLLLYPKHTAFSSIPYNKTSKHITRSRISLRGIYQFRALFMVPFPFKFGDLDGEIFPSYLKI